MIRRIPYPLPQKRQKVRSGIARAPQRVWLRHRKFVRGHRCCVPGCDAFDIQFAHIRTAANAGTGLKPHDRYGVPLCVNHHREQHDCGQGTFEDRHQIDLGAIAAELVRRSPDVRMRLALMEEEEQNAPHEKQRPAASGVLTGTCPETSSSLGCNTAEVGHRVYSGNRDVTAGRDRHPSYRLAGHLSRISRLIPYEGFVS